MKPFLVLAVGVYIVGVHHFQLLQETLLKINMDLQFDGMWKLCKFSNSSDEDFDGAFGGSPRWIRNFIAINSLGSLSAPKDTTEIAGFWHSIPVLH